MPEDRPTAEPSSPKPAEPELPPFVLEPARSSRSRCKTCRKMIDKGALRLGILVEGPYGPGHMWHHLKCAARRQFERVEEAYGLRAWELAKEPLPADEVPPLEELKKLRDEADTKKKERQELPYAELAPSGRSSCKHSGETIEKGAPRVVLGRSVEFGQQTRTTPINVLPEYVAAELARPDCATPSEGFAETLRANSSGLTEAQLDELLERIGPLEG